MPIPLPSARDDWKRAYSQVRRDVGVAGWVIAAFPRGWMATAALTRMKVLELQNPRPSHRAAVALMLAAIHRKGGDLAEARRVVQIARRANAFHSRIPTYGV